ncbi:MAG: translesion error-prone DNA polymerase V autoproteolytic subunit [Alphaproteobacteria bacterium]|nr:translesion error-prone DNA polymerase V autoproteolytic subunit [Alphaproteobacteria bacterium]
MEPSAPFAELTSPLPGTAAPLAGAKAGGSPVAGGGPEGGRATVPFFDQALQAGFPSPAADHQAIGLDLTSLLIRHPAATFMLRISGDSMTGAGILDGDLAIVDRSINAKPGHVVVAVLEGEFVLKRLRLRGGRLFLDAENPKFNACIVPTESGFEIWGVVVATIRRHLGEERGCG